MLTLCPSCRVERDDMDVYGETVVCPSCGHERAFVKPPLVVVTGASGAGMATVHQELVGRVDAVFVEEAAVAAGSVEFRSENALREYLLARARDIAQSGVTPVLFSAALGKPDAVEDLTNRRYFGDAHHLALVCEEDVQAERLRSRPGWSGEGSWAGVERQLAFNNWLKDHAEGAGIDTVDTTDEPVSETAERVAGWLAGRV